jgi:hypothetical protein
VSQLEENLKVVDMMDKITPELLERVDLILENQPVRPQF